MLNPTLMGDLKDGPDGKGVGVHDAEVQKMCLQHNGEKHRYDEEPDSGDAKREKPEQDRY